jgi:erythromycin esterase-like protein
MGRRGELNVGQLVRGRYGDEALIGGFTTFAGTVTAASDWGAVAERKNVRPCAFGQLGVALPRHQGAALSDRDGRARGAAP